MKSHSIYYGRPRLGANKFPGYTTEELRRDLANPSIDSETAANIATEIERRKANRHYR